MQVHPSVRRLSIGKYACKLNAWVDVFERLTIDALYALALLEFACGLGGCPLLDAVDLNRERRLYQIDIHPESEEHYS